MPLKSGGGASSSWARGFLAVPWKNKVWFLTMIIMDTRRMARGDCNSEILKVLLLQFLHELGVVRKCLADAQRCDPGLQKLGV